MSPLCQCRLMLEPYRTEYVCRKEQFQSSMGSAVVCSRETTDKRRRCTVRVNGSVLPIINATCKYWNMITIRFCPDTDGNRWSKAFPSAGPQQTAIASSRLKSKQSVFTRRWRHQITDSRRTGSTENCSRRARQLIHTSQLFRNLPNNTANYHNFLKNATTQ